MLGALLTSCDLRSVGISDDKLELIFREFEHMSTIQEGVQPTEHSPINVGLGLAIVARIVRTIGGQLRVESKLGEGTKLTFILPFRLPSTSTTSSPRRTDDAADFIFASFSSPPPSDAARPLAHPRPRVNSNTALGRPRKHTSASEGNKSELEEILGALSSSHLHPDSTAYSTRTSGIKTPQSSIAASPPLVNSSSYSSNSLPVSPRPELSHQNLDKAGLLQESSFPPGEAKVQSLPNFSRSPSVVRTGGSLGNEVRAPRTDMSGVRDEAEDRESASEGSQGLMESLSDFSIVRGFRRFCWCGSLISLSLGGYGGDGGR